ncbi:hypothetical protein LTR94_031048, partial [Friedmanniomyces endolithicus]
MNGGPSIIEFRATDSDTPSPGRDLQPFDEAPLPVSDHADPAETAEPSRRGAILGPQARHLQAAAERIDLGVQHARGADGRGGLVQPDGTQVVLFGPDVRRLPDPGLCARRTDLFPAAALDAGGAAQRGLSGHAAEGQDGRSVQCVLGGGIPRRAGATAGAGRARRRHHHPHGPAHAAGLRAGLGAADARRSGAG